MIVLRPYQVDVADRVMQALAAGERPIIVAPTGSGKTVVLAEVIKRCVSAHKRILVLAHRREIIHQTKQKLEAHGVRCSIIMASADDELRLYEPVQVAAIATLWVRAIRSNRIQLPLADLIIIDEAHHAVARTYRKVVEAYPNAMVLGATATPVRGDGRGLGGIFTTLIEAPQILELIEQGHLVRSRVYAPIDPDLRGVGTRNGDYVESQLSDRMDRDALVGDIVTHWHKLGERRRTVAFACSVAHSIHITDEFTKSGVKAEHIDGGTPTPERDAVLGRLASGETQVVSNCMVLTEGWDMPEVGCCILARPTKRMGLFRQMIGRVLRPADGKRDCIVLDHSGAVFRHGLPEDRVEWSLSPDKKAGSPEHQARLEHKVPGLIECTQCSALRLGGQPCPACGFMPRRPGEYVRHVEGELGLVTAGKPKAPVYDPVERARWHAMFAYIANERGYKPGWAAVNHKEKFGAWPPYGSRPEPIEPTPEVLSWVRSRMIAFARARERSPA
jgi:superfamily II DNA or RNA helicase